MFYIQFQCRYYTFISAPTCQFDDGHLTPLQNHSIPMYSVKMCVLHVARMYAETKHAYNATVRTSNQYCMYIPSSQSMKWALFSGAAACCGVLRVVVADHYCVVVFYILICKW